MLGALYSILINKEGVFMKAQLTQLVLGVQKIDRQYIQLAMVLVALVLMVLGVGAPDDRGVPFGR